MGTGQTCENFAQLPRPHDCPMIVPETPGRCEFTRQEKEKGDRKIKFSVALSLCLQVR